ncbi:helix-turn-helix domain-containing protein [Oleiharenicola lentus]|uniref:helix-turn-helix domain-containing protein n=1 Tax=Oleiharenicola lentus TaxID=2508720 RepID=UPI003F668265
MDALPICQLTLAAPKPAILRCAIEPRTLGEHLKKCRMDRRLFQKHVAAEIGVTTSTMVNWEKAHGTVELPFIPAVLRFIGYDPRPRPSKLPKLIVWYREGHGWSQSHFAARLGVDVSTLARWERGERKPQPKLKARLAAVSGCFAFI